MNNQNVDSTGKRRAGVSQRPAKPTCSPPRWIILDEVWVSAWRSAGDRDVGRLVIQAPRFPRTERVQSRDYAFATRPSTSLVRCLLPFSHRVLIGQIVPLYFDERESIPSPHPLSVFRLLSSYLQRILDLKPSHLINAAEQPESRPGERCCGCLSCCCC